MLRRKSYWTACLPSAPFLRHCQDAFKVGFFYLLKKHNIFGYNDTGKLVLPDSTLKYIEDHKKEYTATAPAGKH